MVKTKGTILFVEDDSVDRMAFTRHARENDFPYAYELAGSVSEASGKLASGSFDAVILDYSLGDGTAFDLFESIKNASIIMVTGKGDVEIAIQAMKKGAFDYLEKDPNGNYLKIMAMTVENAISRRKEEEELNRYRQQLEDLVKERTIKLKKAVVRYQSSEVRLKQAYQMQMAINGILKGALEDISLEQYLGRTLDIILSLPDYSLLGSGSIFLVDENEPDKLAMKVSRGLNSQQKEVCKKVPIGVCVCGRAAKQRAFISLDSDHELHEIKLKGVESHTHYAIPILSGEKLIGVISLCAEKSGRDGAKTDKSFLTIARTLAGIIELYRAEEEKKTLHDQLVEAQKIDSVGRLAGGIAHDFNNLLSAINGYAQLGSLNSEGFSDFQEYFNNISTAGERAADLTRQLLAFSRKQMIKPEIVNFNNMIDNSLKILSRIIGEDIAIHIEKMEPVWSIKADATHMNQVIMNLAVNARDAMPEGGQLSIETRNVIMDEKATRLRVGLNPGQYVMLKISDTGCGMAPDVQEHVFEPFFTTKEVGKGTGLGLSTVHGIVKQHRGDIDLFSIPGKGTTFKLYFPSIGEKSTAAKKEKKNDLPCGSETILLVEDETVVRNFAMDFLDRIGYRVLVARDGLQAMDLVDENKETINLLLTDVVMPKMSGVELAQKVLAQYPDIKVVFMSGYTEDTHTIQKLLEDRANLITKPLMPKALAETLREVLDDRASP